jgi:hypothetical protein
MSSIDHTAAECLLLTVGAKQASLPFGRLQAKAAMPQAYVESEEHGRERMDAIPREMAECRRLEWAAQRGAFSPSWPGWGRVYLVKSVTHWAPYLPACESVGGGNGRGQRKQRKGDAGCVG